MVELGPCVGRCKNLEKCFFTKLYFMCPHICCYNVANKFRHCILCGNNKLRYPMKTENVEEITLNHSILKTTYCYCIKI